jgi:hypothetical protein
MGGGTRIASAGTSPPLGALSATFPPGNQTSAIGIVGRPSFQPKTPEFGKSIHAEQNGHPVVL